MVTTKIVADNAASMFAGVYGCLNSALTELAKEHKLAIYEKRDVWLKDEDCAHDLSNKLLIPLVSEESSELINKLDLNTILGAVRRETEEIISIKGEFYHTRCEISQPEAGQPKNSIAAIDGVPTLSVIADARYDGCNSLSITDSAGSRISNILDKDGTIWLNYHEIKPHSKVMLEVHDKLLKFYQTEINSAKAKLGAELEAEARANICQLVNKKYSIKNIEEPET